MARSLEPLARSAAVALAGWLAAGAMLAAGAAEAARLVDVRVGRHPDFVRVVFETDAPAAIVVEAGGAGESRVRIDAAAPEALAVPPGSGAEVTLERLPGGATLARIRAEAPVRVESQVLDRPPRIVFDLRPGAVAEAPAPPPEPEATEPAPPEANEPALAEATEAPEPEATELPEASEPPATMLAPEIEAPAILPDLARPLADSPELAIPEAPIPEPPPARPEPEPIAEAAPTAEPAPTAAPALPPVSAAPPAALAPRLDGRSLWIGAAGGLALGLGVALLARGRRAQQPGPSPIPPMEAAVVHEAPVAAEPRAPVQVAPSPPPEPLATDLLAMIQRLDERLAGTEQALTALAERSEQLERRTGLGAEELASQRAALVRLDRALGRPLGRPDRAGAPDPPAAPLASTPAPR